MFRFNRIVCLLLVCSIVGVAFGAAIKIKFLVPEGGDNADADGMVIMNYHPGNDATETQIVLTDFTPNTEYKVVVYRAQIAPPHAEQGMVEGYIITNTSGNGHLHDGSPNNGDLTNLVTGIYVYFDNTSPNVPFELPHEDDVIRATGLFP